MSDNLKIYNGVRTVPANAQKQIQAGRLKGKTDINPMWRIKALTEQFGPCGIGWKYEIADKRLEQGGNNEIAAFVDINLYIKVDGEWSDAIPGTGGSSFVANESKGPYVSDECFKMALTDAISVSCKALGFGADVYWEKDSSKYDRPQQDALERELANGGITQEKAKVLEKMIADKGGKLENTLKFYKVKALTDLTVEQAGHLQNQLLAK